MAYVGYSTFGVLCTFTMPYKSKSFIPSLKDEEGSVADSDKDKANLLNATFHKVFKNDDGTDLTSDCLSSPQQCLHNYYISEDVSSAMHNIQMNFPTLLMVSLLTS